MRLYITKRIIRNLFDREAQRLIAGRQQRWIDFYDAIGKRKRTKLGPKIINAANGKRCVLTRNCVGKDTDGKQLMTELKLCVYRTWLTGRWHSPDITPDGSARDCDKEPRDK
jgi:hypothetical protein